MSASVQAQAQAQEWEIEVHGGGSFESPLSGGTVSFPPSQPLNLITGRPSRQVSSWFFGDGAELANQGARLLNPPFAGRIAPLDSLLTDPLAERESGGSIGFRVGRELTPRFLTEFSFDYAATPLRIPEATASGIQATADSFRPVFRGFFFPLVAPTGSPSTVSSSSTIQDDDGSQIVATVAMSINLMTRGRFIPYATVGAGIIANRGETPTAALEGNYALSLFTIFPFSETDAVALRHAIDDTLFVGVFGGGFRVFLTPRSGVRFDFRGHVGDTRVRTSLAAHPDVALASAARAYSFATPTNPSIYWSNNPITGSESSLTGPDVSDFDAFEVSGVITSFLVSVGYFWRF